MPADEQPLRILIADRDAIFRRGVREIVNEELGLQVVGEAIDAEQVIKLARQLRPGLDLILVDVELPHPDGFAAAERLTPRPGLAIAYGVAIALFCTLGGIFLSLITNAPVSVFVTSLSFACYLVARFAVGPRRRSAGERRRVTGSGVGAGDPARSPEGPASMPATRR